MCYLVRLGVTHIEHIESDEEGNVRHWIESYTEHSGLKFSIRTMIIDHHLYEINIIDYAIENHEAQLRMKRMQQEMVTKIHRTMDKQILNAMLGNAVA